MKYIMVLGSFVAVFGFVLHSFLGQDVAINKANAQPKAEKVESQSLEKTIKAMSPEQIEGLLKLLESLGLLEPQPSPAPIVKITKWQIYEPSGLRTGNAAFEGVVKDLVDGEYRAVAISEPGQPAATMTINVKGGQAPQPPPGPEPKPDPPIPPVVEGPRNIIIFRETKDTTPEFARVISNLRSGPNADYLKSKGHTLTILDVDSKKGSGEQSKLVQDWLPAMQGMRIPSMVIYDTKKIYDKRELPVGTTADKVIETVKGTGG